MIEAKSIQHSVPDAITECKSVMKLNFIVEERKSEKKRVFWPTRLTKEQRSQPIAIVRYWQEVDQFFVILFFFHCIARSQANKEDVRMCVCGIIADTFISLMVLMMIIVMMTHNFCYRPCLFKFQRWNAAQTVAKWFSASSTQHFFEGKFSCVIMNSI